MKEITLILKNMILDKLRGVLRSSEMQLFPNIGFIVFSSYIFKKWSTNLVKFFDGYA